MMPAKSDEYEDNKARAKAGKPGQTVTQEEANANSASDPLEHLSKAVASKVQGNQRKELPLLKVFAALFAMIVLLSGVLAGMGIIEYGSVYMTWCTSFWWFHLWYITCKCINVGKCHHPARPPLDPHHSQ